MTNEAIKALMVLAMFGVLEFALYFSSMARPAKQPVRSKNGPGRVGRRLTPRASED
ncbi:hypothetical protein [Bradyrhizobium sp. CCBAU 51627]|uniref:hypothetical protein n=1 Tax=Bradyrhizobium sp. CCBAU 51627 TaxID=1325088 RepID=UPI00230651D6|nr:hypothetical protein [Bradyrhizobium sp. CCBAU 51627]